MAEQTTREMALTLFQRLVKLEIERAAMIGLLNVCRDIDTHLPLDWKTKVAGIRTEIVRDNPASKYAHIEQAILNATPECSKLLGLLLELVDSPLVPE